MLRVERAVFPSSEQWEIVVHGTRNAFKSWERSDSQLIGCNPTECWGGYGEPEHFHLGEKDRQLLKNLCNAQGGEPSHSKFLRQLPVILDIEAPEYFWRQLDTYKVGTTANSTSQMHTLFKKGFSLDDFSFDYVKLDYAIPKEMIVESLNNIREAYLNETDPEQKEILWHQALELIPQSFNYTRTWSANYQVLRTIVKQRSNHKLPEWHTFIDWIRENVPMARELIFNEWEDDEA